jgi:hypothetical protein
MKIGPVQVTADPEGTVTRPDWPLARLRARKGYHSATKALPRLCL